MLRTIGLLLLALGSTLSAQTTEPGLADRTSANFDVTFRPFADAKPADKRAAGEIARWTRDDLQWSLVFERVDLADPKPLNDVHDPVNGDRAGYLSVAINSLRTADPTSEIYRNDLMDLGQIRIGVLVASTRNGDKERQLLQRAIIEITPRLYYGITMRSPAPAGDPGKDPNAQQAAAAFQAMVSSVERVDLSKVREDQDRRLLRAKQITMEWSTRRLRSALTPELFLRVRRDGKDVGYIYAIEELAESLPRLGSTDRTVPVDPEKASGVRVGLRTHTLLEDGKSVDAQSWLFVTNDRNHEAWSMISLARDPSAKADADREVKLTELGASDLQTDRIFDRKMRAADYKELDKKKESPFREVETHKLSVTFEGRLAPQPVERDLPQFYLPQAVNWLLPRLMPRDRPEAYLFAVYANANRQIMLEYVDVGVEQDATLGGKVVRAVPVSIRIGDDQNPVVHYVTPDGRYVGTVNRAAHTEIIPTDRETLAGLWKDADLTPPNAAKR